MCRIDGNQSVCRTLPVKGLEVERTVLGKKHYARLKSCNGCKKPFQAHPTIGWHGTTILVVEEQVSWFRGDDEITYWHPECFKPEGFRP